MYKGDYNRFTSYFFSFFSSETSDPDPVPSSSPVPVPDSSPEPLASEPVFLSELSFPSLVSFLSSLPVPLSCLPSLSLSSEPLLSELSFSELSALSFTTSTLVGFAVFATSGSFFASLSFLSSLTLVSTFSSLSFLSSFLSSFFFPP